MALKNIALKNSLLNRLLLFLTFVMLAQYATAGGGSTKYYYKAKATSSPQAAGLVYASADTEHGPWLFKNEISSRHYEASSENGSITLSLHAEPQEGYVFKNWTDSSGVVVNNSGNYSFKIYSTDITKPQVLRFTANFVETTVSVFSANQSLCQVSVSPQENHRGDYVTLSAVTSNCSFIGWRKKGTSEIVSTNPSYGVHADTKVTYEAVFREYQGAQKSFIRLQSKSEPYKFISMKQDEFNYTKVFTAANGYSNISGDKGKKKALEAASTYVRGGSCMSYDDSKVLFTAEGDLFLTDNVFDAGSVVYRNSDNFYVQGTNMKYITDGYACHHKGNSSLGDDISLAHFHVPGQGADFTEKNGGYTFHMSPSMYGVSLGTIYVYNNGGVFDVTQTSSNDDSYIWNMVALDAINQYFAFQPTIESNNKYYTTLRTGFSYKVKNPDKVCAYEIEEIDEEGQFAIKRKFESNEIIPGDLAIVLESVTQEPTDNILIPYDLDFTKKNSVLYGKYGKRLHCYLGNEGSDNYDNCTEDGIGFFKVPYKGTSTIYKLSNDSEKGVGFWTQVANNEVISGNEGYSYYPCALFPRVKTPVITPASQSGLVAGENVAVTINCETNGATIWYSLNGGEWQEYTEPFSVTNDVAGDVTIKAKATKDCFLDSHESEVTTYTFNALSAPTLSPTSVEANVGQTITFSATNPNGGSSSLKYRVDDGEWTATDGTITLTSTEVKTGTVYVKVVNGSAESEAVSATYSFKSDYQSITLANLVNQNPSDTKYEITDLTAVCILDEPGLIICKDDDGYANKDVKTNDSWVDYMHTVSGFENEVPDTYDQSNWIALRLPQGVSVTADLIGKHLTSVRGTLVNNTNPEFLLVEAPGVDNVEPANTQANTYIPASFYGANNQQGSNDKIYFFVQPKPMEFANIEWAQWDGEKFVVPNNEAHPEWNAAGLGGQFGFNGLYMDEPVKLEVGHSYRMDGSVIKLKSNDETYDPLYVIGNVNNLNYYYQNWDLTVGVPMYTDDGRVYSIVVEATPASDGISYFAFATQLSQTWNSDNILGAVTNDNGAYWVVYNGGNHFGETINLTGEKSLRIPLGQYRMVVDKVNKTLVITQMNNSSRAPMRDDSKQYVVYPTNLTKTTQVVDGVITDVMQLGAQREVAIVEYYNLAGMRSTQPWQGINIVVTRYTDGTTSTTKRIKR